MRRFFAKKRHGKDGAAKGKGFKGFFGKGSDLLPGAVKDKVGTMPVRGRFMPALGHRYRIDMPADGRMMIVIHYSTSVVRHRYDFTIFGPLSLNLSPLAQNFA